MDLLHEILKADLPVPQATSNSTSNANTTLQLSEIIPDVSHLANNTISKDAQDSRGNIRQLLAQGTNAITDLVVVAKTTNAPRAYEVLATLLKTVAELNHDLMKVHKDEQLLVTPEEQQPSEVHNHIDKAVFVGSTAELGQMMKEQHGNSSTGSTITETKEISNV